LLRHYELNHNVHNSRHGIGWGFRSSRMFRSLRWLFFNDVSGTIYLSHRNWCRK